MEIVDNKTYRLTDYEHMLLLTILMDSRMEQIRNKRKLDEKDRCTKGITKAIDTIENMLDTMETRIKLY